MKKLLLATAMFIFSSPVWAGIYLEPYVGYASGTSKGSITIQGFPASTVDEKDTGTVFGAKAGYSILGFAFGADYMAASITGKDQNTPANPDSKSKGADLGLFVQYKLPVFLKFSASYFLSSKLKDDNDMEATGKGLKLGVGFTGLPFVAINLDMIAVNYSDITIPNLVVTSSDVDFKAYMLSVSVPFNF